MTRSEQLRAEAKEHARRDGVPRENISDYALGYLSGLCASLEAEIARVTAELESVQQASLRLEESYYGDETDF